MVVDNNPKIICLTPTKNDAWVLDRFLKSASMWADTIIIADQMSTDGSREIISKYPKAKLINNNSVVYNELGRKKLLIDEARKIDGDKILITLDVDEMFSPEIFTSGEWQRIKQLPKGTVIYFTWANFTKNAEKMWIGYSFPWGYIDDGFNDYDIGIPSNSIHCSRVPISDNMPEYHVETFKVIHFQYTDWQRMVHKHYYYQCLEIISYPDKSPYDIYRQYHHMDSIKNEDLLVIPQSWINWYKNAGIDILSIQEDGLYWYDIEVIQMIVKYGAHKFAQIPIWDINWEAIRQKAEIYSNHPINDPRSINVKILHLWLSFSQNKMNHKNIRRIDRIIKKLYNKKCF